MPKQRGERIIERTNHTPELYTVAFGSVIDRPEVRTILDVGAGDSTFAESRSPGQCVTRVDKDYGRSAPEGGDYISCDITSGIPRDPETFDTAISSFLMQHLTPDEQAAAIVEMLRVTKKYHGEYSGVIGLYPVFNPDSLHALIHEHGLGNEMRLERSKKLNDTIKLRKLECETLWIANARDPEQTVELATMIAKTGSFYRRRKLKDWPRQLGMRATNDPTSRVNV